MERLVRMDVPLDGSRDHDPLEQTYATTYVRRYRIEFEHNKHETKSPHSHRR